MMWAGNVGLIGGTTGIPLESIRLKRFRTVGRDYEYAKWLAEHGRAPEVTSIVTTLFPDASSATANKDGSGVGSLLAARAQMAQLVRDLTPTAVDRTIAFSSDRDGDFEIFTVTGQWCLATSVDQQCVIDRFPEWSPTGDRIAWTQGSDVLTMATNGTGVVNLTADIADLAEKPAWSPDGSTIVFVRQVAGRSEIWKMSAASGANKQAIVTFAGTGARCHRSDDHSDVNGRLHRQWRPVHRSARWRRNHAAAHRTDSR